MNVQPINTNILVTLKVPKNKENKIGELYIPESNKQSDIVTADVIEVSKGFWEHGNFVQLKVKKGDIVLFDKGHGIEVKFGDNQKYLILSEKGILAIVKTEIL